MIISPCQSTILNLRSEIRLDTVHVLTECIQPPCPPEELFERFTEEPYPFYLDSATTDSDVGRYSILGAKPFLVHRSKGTHISCRWEGRREGWCADPWEALRNMFSSFSSYQVTNLPFVGGFVGYLAYDLGQFIEEIPPHAQDDIQLPDCWFAAYGAVCVFDHQDHNLYLIASDLGPNRHSRLAQQRLEWLKTKLQTGSTHRHKSGVLQRYPLHSGFSRDEYIQAVERVKEYIAAGDIYQANLSQRFHTRWPGQPVELYRRLRQRNPAPFAAYLDTGDAVILSSSPERFLKLDSQSRIVETRPIKGTRPRGKTGDEDRALAEMLLSSPKDRAELLMIVDLERNDLGRVCDVGSVHVPSLFRLESYATVHHLVSTVAGTLKREHDCIDLLRATFPGGSITGAPKIRAMQIIEELEPTRRHVYTGSIGYLSFSGDLDLNIAIRTILLKGEDVYFQLGGGIVADSDPVLEYEETLHKGRALLELFQ